MPEFALWFPIALDGLALIALLAALTWVASLVQHDVSLVDRVWSVLIAGAALVYASVYASGYASVHSSMYASLPAVAAVPAGAVGARVYALLALVLAWGLRLAYYITRRNWGHGEDRRYQQIRARNQPNFAFKSLYLVFVLQAVLAWLVSAPTLAAVLGTRACGALDVAGLAVCAIGLFFEAVGDAQMASFKASPAHAGQVMDRGLWRYTRHPNYFGETAFWWGVWLVALAATGWSGAWTVVSPIVMTVLLLKVSGVSLLEKDIGERRPGYRDYVSRTNAFFPGPPRREER